MRPVITKKLGGSPLPVTVSTSKSNSLFFESCDNTHTHLTSSILAFHFALTHTHQWMCLRNSHSLRDYFRLTSQSISVLSLDSFQIIHFHFSYQPHHHPCPSTLHSALIALVSDFQWPFLKHAIATCSFILRFPPLHLHIRGMNETAIWLVPCGWSQDPYWHSAFRIASAGALQSFCRACCTPSKKIVAQILPLPLCTFRVTIAYYSSTHSPTLLEIVVASNLQCRLLSLCLFLWYIYSLSPVSKIWAWCGCYTEVRRSSTYMDSARTK